MFPLVEFPELVQHYAPYFKDVFSPEAFIEFERYISGLIVSENKTIEGINRLMVVESRNQSSLNRLLTKSPYELRNLNQARLNVMNSLPGTKMKPSGVFSLDDTLLIHYGDDFEKIAKLWDHVSGTYVWAHDLVTIHYSDDDTDYPAVFQLWEPVELEKLEQGIRAAQIKIKPEKRRSRKLIHTNGEGICLAFGDDAKKNIRNCKNYMTARSSFLRNCCKAGLKVIRTNYTQSLLTIGLHSPLSADFLIRPCIWLM